MRQKHTNLSGILIQLKNIYARCCGCCISNGSHSATCNTTSKKKSTKKKALVSTYYYDESKNLFYNLKKKIKLFVRWPHFGYFANFHRVKPFNCRAQSISIFVVVVVAYVALARHETIPIWRWKLFVFCTQLTHLSMHLIHFEWQTIKDLFELIQRTPEFRIEKHSFGMKKFSALLLEFLFNFTSQNFDQHVLFWGRVWIVAPLVQH